MTTPQGMLAPCPFCGGEGELNVLYEDGTIGLDVAESACEIEFVVVRCSACGISGEKPTPADAIKWRNTRQAAAPQGREALMIARNCIEDLGSGKGGWAWEEVLQQIDIALTPAVAPDGGMGERDAVIEECAKVADRASESDFEYAAKYPDEGVKYENRAHRANTIAVSIRALAQAQEPGEDYNA